MCQWVKDMMGGLSTTSNLFFSTMTGWLIARFDVGSRFLYNHHDLTPPKTLIKHPDSAWYIVRVSTWEFPITGRDLDQGQTCIRRVETTTRNNFLTAKYFSYSC